MGKKSLFLMYFGGFLVVSSCENPLKEALKTPPTPYNFVTPQGFPPPILPDDNTLTNEGIALGRHLFYDTQLSRNNTQSCASCHGMTHALTDNGKKLSTGIDGIAGRRNSMPLFNLAWNASPYFWDGRTSTLRQQVLMPIQDPTEMHETLPNAIKKLEADEKYPLMFAKAFNTKTITAENTAKALEQFLLSIVSANARYDKYLRGETALTLQELNGRTLFDGEFKDVTSGAKSGGDCFHCHGNILFTTNRFTNNGLDANFDADKGRNEATGLPQDIGKFKVPTLRNIALTAPYMHDGRFATLKETLDFYNFHQKTSPTIDPVIKSVEEGLRFTPSDISDMEAFLNTLTDYEFLNNPAYQSPY